MERRWTFLTTIALVMAIGTLVLVGRVHQRGGSAESWAVARTPWGDYRLPTILAGARAEEKAAGEASVR